MHSPRFDTTIVLTHRDIEAPGSHENLMVVMEAVEHAIAAVPGAEAIDISYFGTRDQGKRRARVYPHGAHSRSCIADDWNVPLRRRIEAVAGGAIAAFAHWARLEVQAPGPLGLTRSNARQTDETAEQNHH